MEINKLNQILERKWDAEVDKQEHLNSDDASIGGAYKELLVIIPSHRDAKEARIMKGAAAAAALSALGALGFAASFLTTTTQSVAQGVTNIKQDIETAADQLGMGVVGGGKWAAGKLQGVSSIHEKIKSLMNDANWLTKNNVNPSDAQTWLTRYGNDPKGFMGDFVQQNVGLQKKFVGMIKGLTDSETQMTLAGKMQRGLSPISGGPGTYTTTSDFGLSLGESYKIPGIQGNATVIVAKIITKTIMSTVGKTLQAAGYGALAGGLLSAAVAGVTHAVTKNKKDKKVTSDYDKDFYDYDKYKKLDKNDAFLKTQQEDYINDRSRLDEGEGIIKSAVQSATKGSLAQDAYYDIRRPYGFIYANLKKFKKIPGFQDVENLIKYEKLYCFLNQLAWNRVNIKVDNGEWKSDKTLQNIGRIAVKAGCKQAFIRNDFVQTVKAANDELKSIASNIYNSISRLKSNFKEDHIDYDDMNQLFEGLFGLGRKKEDVQRLKDEKQGRNKQKYNSTFGFRKDDAYGRYKGLEITQQQINWLGKTLRDDGAQGLIGVDEGPAIEPKDLAPISGSKEVDTTGSVMKGSPMGIEGEKDPNDGKNVVVKNKDVETKADSDKINQKNAENAIELGLIDTDYEDYVSVLGAINDKVGTTRNESNFNSSFTFKKYLKEGFILEDYGPKTKKLVQDVARLLKSKGENPIARIGKRDISMKIMKYKPDVEKIINNFISGKSDDSSSVSLDVISKEFNISTVKSRLTALLKANTGARDSFVAKLNLKITGKTPGTAGYIDYSTVINILKYLDQKDKMKLYQPRNNSIKNYTASNQENMGESIDNMLSIDFSDKQVRKIARFCAEYI